MRTAGKIGLRKIAQKMKRHKLMYKVVDYKKISAGIDHTSSRKVYASGVIWSQVGRQFKILWCATRWHKCEQEQKKQKDLLS